MSGTISVATIGMRTGAIGIAMRDVKSAAKIGGNANVLSGATTAIPTTRSLTITTVTPPHIARGNAPSAIHLMRATAVLFTRGRRFVASTEGVFDIRTLRRKQLSAVVC